jgi:Ca2+-binding RTX toxin-like protein
LKIQVNICTLTDQKTHHTCASSQLLLFHVEVNGRSICEIENLKTQKTCGINVAEIVDKSVSTQRSNEMARIDGTPLDDILYGTFEADSIYGYEGDDEISGYEGDDLIYGGQGNDTLYSAGSNATLIGGAGNDTLDGYGNNTTMYGGAGNDTLFGGKSGDSTLFGGVGDDTLEGGYAGNNYLVGGRGNDILRSNQKNDTLTGGFGADIFQVYFYSPDLIDGYATITDFRRAQGDKIQVYGSASDYSLDQSQNLSGQLALDTAIYYSNVLIAVLQDTTIASLSSDFIFG